DNAVKKSGDEITGQLRFSPTSYGIKFLHENKNELVMRPSGDSFIYAYYDAESERWANKLRYVASSNSWRFENIDDVTINNKSVLKTGDAVQLLGDLSNTNLNNLTGFNEGIYFQGKNVQATPENNYPINEAGTLQVLKNGADGAGCCQIYTAYRNARQFIRNYRGGSKSWEPWIEQITSGNSTVDSNGFLKKASPILRLFANDNIEEADGFKKSGCALVNDLASGVTATRIDVGHYEIHGSLGFAKEGWYITLPEDVNGNKKFFAEYSVDENNIITVKTYTKKFDFENCQIVAGEPIDITEGRWIDIRLEMPVIENEEPIPSTLNPVIVSEVSDDI
ncbi:pyocin knob domain-containing protein, partial [Gilliamella sp. Imp1-1]